MNLKIEHSGIKRSMLKALGNVVPRHLLDRRFDPLLGLRETYARTTILPMKNLLHIRTSNIGSIAVNLFW